MERHNQKLLFAGIAAAALATLGALPVAHADLVYEDTPEGVRSDARSDLRQAIGSAERAQITNQVQVAAPAAAPITAVVAEQPAAGAPAGDSADDMRNMNRSELLRRQRVREELRNEDALQERLEELRLRDEKKRTDQILGVAPKGDAAQSQQGDLSLPAPVYGAAPGAAGAPNYSDQAVAAPITEHPGQAAKLPSNQMANQMAGIAAVNAADASGGQSVAAAPAENPEKDKLMISVMPRAGIGGMSSQAGYKIDPHFAAGVGIEASANDYVGIEIGYTYAEYGVQAAPDNALVAGIAAAQQAYNNGNFETLTMKQNVFDAGVKVHLLGRDSAIRPFIGGGGAYSRSYINYSQQVLSQLNNFQGLQGLTSDYTLSQYLGYLEAGADVRMSKAISIGLMFRYYQVLSSSQNNDFNNYSLLNPSYNVAQLSPSKQYVGGAVAGSGFYNVLAGVSFSF